MKGIDNVVLVTGGRNYHNRSKIAEVLGACNASDPIGILVEGGGDGADAECRLWAMENGIQVATCEALWDYYGPSAGPRRNSTMLLLQPNVVIAFPGGKGTANMVKTARAAGIDVMEIK